MEAMEAHDVPAWYIESLAKIGYLFPKAHAVAYVMMAFRIAWYKVHEPLAFYATFFSVRAKAFDAEFCCAGKDAVKRKIREIENNKDATAVEQSMMTTLEVCYEFYLRGFHFDTINIYESDATKFKVTEGGLLPPFTSVHGLGEAAALDTVRKAGLCVTDTNLMTPRKSVTALLGVSDHPVKGQLAGCGHCVLRTRCEYRKRGKTCASE